MFRYTLALRPHSLRTTVIIRGMAHDVKSVLRGTWSETPFYFRLTTFLPQQKKKKKGKEKLAIWRRLNMDRNGLWAQDKLNFISSHS